MDDIDRELADLIREWKANQKARQALGANLQRRSDCSQGSISREWM